MVEGADRSPSTTEPTYKASKSSRPAGRQITPDPAQRPRVGRIRHLADVWLFVVGGIVMAQAFGLSAVSEGAAIAVVVAVTATLATLLVITNKQP